MNVDNPQMSKKKNLAAIMQICASMNYTEHSFNTLTLLGDQKRIDPVTANATYPQKLSPKLLFQNQHRKKIKGQPDNPGSSGC